MLSDNDSCNKVQNDIMQLFKLIINDKQNNGSM